MNISLRCCLALTLWIPMVTLSGCSFQIIFPGASTGTGTTVAGLPAPAGQGAPAPVSTLPGAQGAPAPVPVPVPPVNQPGTSSTTPPSATLPAPTDAASYITYLKQKYGIANIDGSAATMDNLTRLDKAYAKLPAGIFKNLAVSFEPASAAPGAPQAPPGSVVDGFWTVAAADGTPLPDQATTDQWQGGHVYYLMPAELSWTMIHEVCHHISLWQNQQMGTSLAQALGYTRKPNDGGADNELDSQDWAATTVDASTQPTDYSQTKWSEHMAELMTTWVHGPPDTENLSGFQDAPFLATYKGAGAAASPILQQEFGPASN